MSRHHEHAASDAASSYRCLHLTLQGQAGGIDIPPSNMGIVFMKNSLEATWSASKTQISSDPGTRVPGGYIWEHTLLMLPDFPFISPASTVSLSLYELCLRLESLNIKQVAASTSKAAAAEPCGVSNMWARLQEHLLERCCKRGSALSEAKPTGSCQQACYCAILLKWGGGEGGAGGRGEGFRRNAGGNDKGEGRAEETKVTRNLPGERLRPETYTTSAAKESTHLRFLGSLPSSHK